MDKIKKYFKVVIIVGIIMILYGLDIRAAYIWDDIYKKELDKKWVLYSSQNNFVLNPYSLFIEQPIYRMGFINKDSIKELSSNVYLIDKLWVVREEDGIEEEYFKYVVDCENGKDGWSEDGSSVKEPVDLSRLKWSDCAGNNFSPNECEIIHNN